LVKRAFAAAKGLQGFRLVHFAVLGDHIHLIAEVDSAARLSKAVQKITISLARLLNLDGVRTAGGTLARTGTPLRERRGWIGKVFKDRYHVHHLVSPSEMTAALNYVLHNARQHYGRFDAALCRVRRENGTIETFAIDFFTSFACQFAQKDPWRPMARGFLLNRALRTQNFR
jgi:REP element-mobilizing transposase RayT